MRTWVKWLLGLVLVPVVVIAAFAAFLVFSVLTAPIDTVGEVEFSRPVAIPPLAESRIDERGRRVFDLSLQEGETDLGREELTETWGVNGSYLGPTLRASRGERVLANVTNDLGEASTLHWHGMHLPAAMDGGPHQMVPPGATWSPTWKVDQPAASLWYHPHPHGETAEQVYRGIAGMFIVDDARSRRLALPRRYGVDDVPLIVQDKKFDGSELDDSGNFPFGGQGVLGDTILVNGTPEPFLDVTTERVRLRVLNASNARPYNLHFDDDRPYQLIATDGGLLPAPVELTHLELSPGERAEIVVTVKPGETTVLRSDEMESSDSAITGASDRMDIIELRAADQLTPSAEVPADLAPGPDLRSGDVVTTREFSLSGSAINGQDMEMDRIDARVPVDTTERWVVRSDADHNFHIHDVQFVIESIDGEAPPPALAGWKDTVYMPGGRRMELLVRFTDYTDADTPYMYHCHILRHEDTGMMGQFVVVDPASSTHGVGGEEGDGDRELEGDEAPHDH